MSQASLSVALSFWSKAKGILASLKTENDMARVSRYGKINLCMKDIGKMIRQMEKVESYTPMVMYTMDNGKMIRLKGMALIIMQMGLVTQDNGFKMSIMVTAYRNGRMVQNTMEIASMVRNMGLAN